MSQQSPTSSASQAPWQHTNAVDGQLPPAKRQRLSPNPPTPSQPSQNIATYSPYANTSNYQNFNLPTNAFANRQQINGSGTDSQYQPHTQYSQPVRPYAGLMGPPQRPIERSMDKGADKNLNKKEEKVDVNDLSDLVFTSGIDIREEENYLQQTYRADLNQGSSGLHAVPSFSSHQSLHQGYYGAISSQHGNLPGTSQKSTEEVINDEHKRAARDFNEKNQYHLANSFLLGACVRTKLESLATDNGVKLPVEGLFDRINNTDRALNVSGSSISNSRGSVTVTRASSLLNKGAPLDGVLSLLSIAANERIRGLLEDAHGMAKSRQTQSDGIIPPEWSDLARKEGTEATTAVPISASGSSWDMPMEVTTDAQKATQDPGLPSPPPSVDSNVPAKPRPTIALTSSQNMVASALVTLSNRDRAAEDARIQKRAARQAKKNAATAASNEESSNAEANAVIQQVNEKAPEPKMTKKEKERLAKQDLTDEVQTRHANAVAAMQTGGKKYSWMTQGAGATGRRPIPAASTSKKTEAKSGETAATGTKEASKDAKEEKKKPKLGDWREDGTGGKGVQLRDWVSVIESDGHELRTLYRALTKLGAESIGIPPRELPPPLPAVDTNLQNSYTAQDYGQVPGYYSNNNTPIATPGYIGHTMTPGGSNAQYGNTSYQRGSPAPPTPSGPLSASAPGTARATPIPQGAAYPHTNFRPPLSQQSSASNLPYGPGQNPVAARSPGAGENQIPSPGPGQARSPIGAQASSPSLAQNFAPDGKSSSGQASSPVQTNG